MKRLIILLLSTLCCSTAWASTAIIEFTSTDPLAETWVFVGTQDCGDMSDVSKCPNGGIAPAGATTLSIANVPPGVPIYAVAKNFWPTTGVSSGWSNVVSSESPALPAPTAPVPFSPPVIIHWQGGNMTITHTKD